MHNFFLHKNILIFRRFFNSANRLYISNTAEIRLSLKPIKTDQTFQKTVCKDALSAHKYHFSRYT